MNLAYTVITNTVKSITRIICDVDDNQLINVPDEGPLILACNHINFIEVPLVFTHLKPRKVTAFAKAETWDNPLMGYLFTLWGAIPIQRGEADTAAFKKGLDALSKGKILAITPEGTRSKDGQMGPGLPGIVLMAQRSNSPILPLVYYGSEKLQYNIQHLKRTEFHIRVGKVFRIKSEENKATRKIRMKIVDEIMYQLAILLPERYRGNYSDLSKLSTEYLNFA
jgi:1-acyl-sn-glycerol-3-phosphate acyltransferase